MGVRRSSTEASKPVAAHVGEQQVGGDPARRDRHAAHAPVRPLRAQHLGEPDQAVLGRSVGGAARHAHEPSTEATLTITPRPRGSMCRAAAWAQAKGATRSSSTSAAELLEWHLLRADRHPIPALLTSTSSAAPARAPPRPSAGRAHRAR